MLAPNGGTSTVFAVRCHVRRAPPSRGVCLALLSLSSSPHRDLNNHPSLFSRTICLLRAQSRSPFGQRCQLRINLLISLADGLGRLTGPCSHSHRLIGSSRTGFPSALVTCAVIVDGGQLAMYAPGRQNISLPPSPTPPHLSRIFTFSFQFLRSSICCTECTCPLSPYPGAPPGVDDSRLPRRVVSINRHVVLGIKLSVTSRR